MAKSDLQSRVDTLYGEINFLKYLFDTVSAVLRRSPSSFPTSCKSENWRRLILPAPSSSWGIPSTSVVLVAIMEMWVGTVSILRSVRVKQFPVLRPPGG